jgi:hypothetical protein
MNGIFRGRKAGPNFQMTKLGEGGEVLTGRHEIMKYMKEAGEFWIGLI